MFVKTTVIRFLSVHAIYLSLLASRIDVQCCIFQLWCFSNIFNNTPLQRLTPHGSKTVCFLSHLFCVLPGLTMWCLKPPSSKALCFLSYLVCVFLGLTMWRLTPPGSKAVYFLSYLFSVLPGLTMHYMAAFIRE